MQIQLILISTAYTSGNAISERLTSHNDDHDSKHQTHQEILNTLGADNERTKGRISKVDTKVDDLKMDMRRIEGKMRGELRNRLSNVRTVLLSALDKAKTDISEIRKDVENAMV